MKKQHIRDWTPPAGFRSGDSLDLSAYKGGKRGKKLMRFKGMNLAELIHWRMSTREFISPRQRALHAAAQNAAMLAADPSFRNLYDEEHGIRDPETGLWLQEPVAK